MRAGAWECLTTPVSKRAATEPVTQPTAAIGWLEFGLGALDLLTRRSARAADSDAETAADAADDQPGALFDELRERFALGFAEATTFSVVAANAGLGLDDAEVLAVLAAAELEPSQHRRIAALQGDAAKNRITLGTLVELFAGVDGHRGVLAVGADAPLRTAAFVDVVPDGPWSDHSIGLHASVAWALVGDLSADPSLPKIHEQLVAAEGSGRPFTVVSGPDRHRRLREAADRTSGDRFLVVTPPTDERGWSALVREATLTGVGVILDIEDTMPVEGSRWIERAGHIPWSIVSRTDLPLDVLPDRQWFAYVATQEPPNDDEWAAIFGETARTHPLKPEQLQRVGRAFEALDGDLDGAVRRLVSGRLDSMARRIRPTRVWSDLVLSPDRKAVLRSIVNRYRHADQVYDDWGFAAGGGSRGIVSLFSGPSGTGKTLAAEVMAGELGLDVFKLDLSSVVSKYIGETEKNLEQVFDAASAGNLVLFFDEADALFGKRSEVKDARDRYANIEVSYLLQRLEAYEGLVVMATNFEKNVDEAFLRRIHTRIEFALPGPTERATIWRQNFPATSPLGDIDIDWLANQFEISGGLIRNAAVQAAFTAAAHGGSISTEDAVLGVALELRKLGRLIKAEGFGQYFDIVTALPSDPEDS